MDINSFGNGYTNTNYQTQMLASYLGGPTSKSQVDDLWQFVADQQSVKVNICLENVGKKVLVDMATQTAEYLSDKPDLTEDYVMVVIEDKVGNREARAYRVDDLTADLEGEEKEKAEEMFRDKRLVYLNTTEDLPDMPDDPELQELAAQAQGFLDKNDKILDLLAKSGIIPWTD